MVLFHAIDHQPSPGIKMDGLWLVQQEWLFWSVDRCWRLNEPSCLMLGCTDVWLWTWLVSLNYPRVCKFWVTFFFLIILYTHQVVVLLKQIVWRNTDVSWIMIDLLIPSPTDHFQSRWDGHSGGEWSCQTGVRGHWCSSTQPHLAQRRQPCGECVTWHSGTVWSTWIQFGSCFMIWL